MYILNNAILGKVLNKYSLSLNQEGLFRRIRIENRADYFIFLTNDVRKIAEIFALDFDTLCEKRGEEGCEFIKTSPYFNAEVFTYVKQNKIPGLISMMTNLITDKDLKKEVLPIDTARVMEVLGMNDLLDRINYFKDVLPKAHKAYKGKFNDMKKAIIDKGYDVRNFSTDLASFIDGFKDDTDLNIRMYEESTESMVERFFMTSVENAQYATFNNR